MRHVVPISGKDSLATALVLKAHHPEIDAEYFFSDTGAELPETYAWLNKVETHLGKINRIGKSLEEFIEKYQYLPSRQARFCTNESKIRPMERLFRQEDKVHLYFGLRADESNRIGYPLKT